MSLKPLFSFCVIVLFYCLRANTEKDNSQLPAFPGAEGFGSHAAGGRGGKVVQVTNLNDNGVGSLRHALSCYPTEPLTIIFGTSGLIKLKSNLKINRSNLTIAGQTAPGDGICLSGYSLIINGASGIKGKDHGNIIIRYLRSRPGGNLPSGLYGIDLENVRNVIIDHCSFSWANEECAALYDVKDISLQWCIISEGLYDAGHLKGKRAYGGVWGGQRVSYHHNLIANQNSRTVRFNGSRAHDTTALVDYRNNVIFNWGTQNASYGGEVEIEGGKSQINMVNNYYMPGPATDFTLKFVKANYNNQKAKGIGSWHLSGNVMLGNTKITDNNLYGIDWSDLPEEKVGLAFKNKPFSIEEYATLQSQTAEAALQSVLNHVGAVYPKRDEVDRRIINSLKNPATSNKGKRKIGIIDSPDDVGGWPIYRHQNPPADSDHDGIPDKWETNHKMNPKDPLDAASRSSNGYTFLELYMNSLVEEFTGK